MRYRHFRQASHQQKSDYCADHVTDDHPRSGEANGKTAAQEQTGTDGSADRDHAQLGGCESAAQSFFAILNDGEVFQAKSSMDEVWLTQRTGEIHHSHASLRLSANARVQESSG